MDFRASQLLSILAVALALGLAPAAAASPADVVRDCAVDGSLDGSYPDEDKRDALEQIPGDVKEYTDCNAVITAAIGTDPEENVEGDDNGALASANDPPGTGDAAPAPQRSAAATRRAKRAQVARRERLRQRREDGWTPWDRLPDRTFGSTAVDPGKPGVVKAADSANDLPLPLTVGLIALALLWLAIGVLLFWRPHALDGFFSRLAPSRFER